MIKKIRLSAMFLLAVSFLMVSCSSRKEYMYYADRENYICITGTVCHVLLSENETELFIAFDNMSCQLSDNCFKLAGENLRTVQKNLDGKDLALGDQLEFITAPRYFGDGYVMPIVSLVYGETELLAFEEGVDNLLTWINS